mgnify:CR=1 FL=1
MMRSRSLQLRSPPLALCTIPAWIAAVRIIWQPAASHAAGTVSMASAASAHEERRGQGGRPFSLRRRDDEEEQDAPRSATEPISSVMRSLAYFHRHER